MTGKTCRKPVSEVVVIVGLCLGIALVEAYFREKGIQTVVKNVPVARKVKGG